MKVNIEPNGVVTLDVSNGESKEAVEFIRLLRGEIKHAPKVKPHKRTRSVTTKAPALPKGLFETLKTLAQNDSEEGLDSKAIAELNKITDRAAHQRLLKLTQKEYAYRVKPGHYRAVPPPTPTA